VGATLRPARAGDGEALARIWLDMTRYHADLAPELFQVPEPEGLSAWFEEWLPTANRDDRLYLVAEIEGTVVGSVLATVVRPAPDAGRQLLRELGLVRLIVDLLVVERPFWRRGVGTALMTAAEKWGRCRGAVVALLDTWIDSPVSVSFYERRMGYRRRALRMRKPLL
jgi:GNAT superfamily N-acetyltransferase